MGKVETLINYKFLASIFYRCQKEVSFPGLIKYQTYIPSINEISLEEHERVKLADTVLWLNRK